jgi:hypothetical protein
MMKLSELIDDEATGLLASTGDCDGLADKITNLANNRERLKTMSRQVAASARERFSLARVVDDYVKVIHEVMEESAISYPVKPWGQFHIEPAFRQSRWRRLIPVRSKRFIKKLLFRLGLLDRYE